MVVTLKPFKASSGMKIAQADSPRPVTDMGMAKKPSQKTNISVHICTQNRENSPQTSSGSAKPFASTTKAQNICRRGGSKRPRADTDTEAESGRPRHIPHFKVPYKPEVFDNWWEMQSQILLSIRATRDQGMIIVLKDQATLNFQKETKELNGGRKVSISTLNPEDRRVKKVLT